MEAAPPHADDVRWMRKALRLALKGLGTTSPNPMVGAVVVKNGRLIAGGYHVRPGEGHAEVNALRAAGKRAKGSCVYVTLEPCSTWGRTPPCVDALLDAGVSRVVVGCLDPNPKHAGAGIEILRKAGVETLCGVERVACERLNEAFFKWICVKRPFVLLKMAETLDGRIACASGDSKWVTGPVARARVQKLRLWADAVLVGAKTYELDGPRLTARNTKGDVIRTPRRFVATSKRLPEACGFEAVSLPDKNAWDAFLDRLGAESVTSLLLEGGGELAASALAAGAVDKVEFHIAPKILGGRSSRPSVGGDSPARMADALELFDVSTRKFGCDVAISGYIKKIEGLA